MSMSSRPTSASEPLAHPRRAADSNAASYLSAQAAARPDYSDRPFQAPGGPGEPVSPDATETAFGRFIRDACQGLGWSMTYFAEQIGVSRQTVYDWRHGSNPSSDKCARIADLLGVPRSVVRYYAGHISQDEVTLARLERSASGRRQIRVRSTGDLLPEAPVAFGQGTIDDVKAVILSTSSAQLSDQAKWALLKVVDQLAVASKLRGQPERPLVTRGATQAALPNLSVSALP